MTKKKRVRGKEVKWSFQENAVLLEAVRRAASKEGPQNWKKVESFLKKKGVHRTGKEARHRMRRIRKGAAAVADGTARNRCNLCGQMAAGHTCPAAGLPLDKNHRVRRCRPVKKAETIEKDKEEDEEAPPVVLMNSWSLVGHPSTPSQLSPATMFRAPHSPASILGMPWTDQELAQAGFDLSVLNIEDWDLQ